MQFLKYYATRYNAVELHGIWYRMPSEALVQSWLDQTPPHFVFAPKAHRRITHMDRLKPEALSAVSFLAERLNPLRIQGRLGPVLLQLPPNLKLDEGRLERFLESVPRDIRWVVEFRHASWLTEAVERLLRHYGVAWASVETDQSPAEWLQTAGFWYVRLRRSEYPDTALADWADKLRAQLDRGRETFVFCKHEDEGSPWLWADRLRELIGR